MSFPKLDVPKFEVTLPITKKKVKYRPFLVKEQKLLMMLDTGNIDEIATAIDDLVRVCTFNEVDPKDLGSVDLEYLFLDIRKRSVGESYDIIVTCGNCQTQINAAADLDKLEVVEDERHEGCKLKISDQVVIEMQYPSFAHVVNVYSNLSEEGLMNLVLNSVKAVHTPEESTEVDDSNRAELKEFLECLTTEQFTKITNFFETMPYILQRIDLVCPECGFENHVEIKGLDNFFG